MTPKLAEARRAEDVLTGRGVRYFVQAEPFGRTLLGFSRTGATFYVAAEQADFCAGVLEAAGLARGVVAKDEDEAPVQKRDDLHAIPDGLPVPADDGASDHLRGMRLPSIPLNSTDGGTVDLAGLQGRTVVYVYPRTGRPEEPGSDAWNAIPGARGCTPQSCGFRDQYQELRSLGVFVAGLSTQTTRYQREAVERLHLPFPLLSDSDLEFTRALRLPTFEFTPYGSESPTHLRRMALVIRGGRIEKVFYPVFPPDKNAEEVLGWLRTNPI